MKKIRGYDDQSRDLGSQGPLASELTIRCNLYDTRPFGHHAEFKAVTDESLDLKEVVCYKIALREPVLILLEPGGCKKGSWFWLISPQSQK